MRNSLILTNSGRSREYPIIARSRPLIIFQCACSDQLGELKSGPAIARLDKQVAPTLHTANLLIPDQLNYCFPGLQQQL